MATQADKYHIAMAGEYFVAAQLQRLKVSAAVTYGNAKSADIIAISDQSDRAVVIEVKSTQQTSWVVGSRVPAKSKKPWVFVFLPKVETDWPRFFILTQTNLHDILEPVGLEYERKFKLKHNEEYGDRAGVVTVKRKDIESYENNWKIVLQLLGT